MSLITRRRRPKVSLVTDDTSAVAASDLRHDRRILRGVVTVLAAALVLTALLLPNQIGLVQAKAFLRIPAEAVIAIAVALVWPARFPRLRQATAGFFGALLGFLLIVKLLDMGFYMSLARPFDLVLDWILLDDAMSFLGDSIGETGVRVLAVALVVLAVAVIVLMALSVMRLSSLVTRHRAGASRSIAVLGLTWALAATLGWQATPALPVAARSEATLAMDRVKAVRAGWADQQVFAAEASVDAFANTPGDQLLTALRGKDVMVTFIESYGRDAVEDPEFATQVGQVLDDGNRRLQSKGFAARSAFLTSSTVGGGSWLAHSTLLSGLWIDNHSRYTNLVASNRLTLTSAFRKAGWRTVGVMPAITRAWPEGNFFGLDKVYDCNNVGYKGPKFSYAPMPDQYSMWNFHRNERAAAHAPVMAEVELISSHSPWTPVPTLLDWDEIGDGSVYHSQVAGAPDPDDVWTNATRGRAEYRRSIEYSLNSIIRYVEDFGDENLVMVFLGDHQPAPLVTGDDASRDVPITIVAKDPAVMDRIGGWKWQDGLKPTADAAPVWKMSEFRDRFLGAFGPNDGATTATHRTN
ncbi:sulfatase [Virgisporangium ochraceum]|uniref:Sulfatase n=1 Tax=Virgisporangium ochraceum TaxID=65505 RepID=A0A8J4EF30_9ACTN|nr:sulfatase [Virgisporangium ochraceum]GIJ72384.1 hypothetical protein Voc01_073010 [Virgisporangium ochraceum]